MNPFKVFQLSPTNVADTVPHWQTLGSKPSEVSDALITKFKTTIDTKLAQLSGSHSVYIRDPITTKSKFLNYGWKDPHSGRVVLSIAERATIITFGEDSDGQFVTIESSPDVVQFLKEILMQ